MRLQSQTRKADRRGQTVRDPRNPSVLRITFYEDVGQGKRRDGVSRWKALAAEHIRLEPSVGVVSTRCDVYRPNTPVDHFCDERHDLDICNRFGCHEHGLLAV